MGVHINISASEAGLVGNNLGTVVCGGPRMIFQIGERVVYPNQGVGIIENISSRSFGTRCERFYLLRLSYSSMTVMVPFSNVGNIGLRKICKNTEINRILHF